MKRARIKVWVKEPHKEAELREVDNTLESFQEIVGGYIETITFASDAVAIVDEEGVLKGKEFNTSFIGVPIVGTLVLAGVRGSEFDDFPYIDIRKVMPGPFKED